MEHLQQPHKENEIYYTSGGTEGDNWAIFGTAEGYQRQGKHLITTKIEHPAVKKPMEALEQKGYERMVNEIVPMQQVEACHNPTKKEVKEAVRKLNPDINSLGSRG